MSRLYGSNLGLERYQFEMPYRLGNQQERFTISHMLYWFTAMAERCLPIPETRLAGNIALENARRTAVSSTVQNYYAGMPVPTDYILPEQQVRAGPGVSFYALFPAENIPLDFKPWLRENHRGGRAWNATLRSNNLPVIIKCWDSHKSHEDFRDIEVKVYMTLQDLWGICIPTFIASGTVEFCYALVLGRLEVIF
jgi:hypothetical protein